MRKIYLLLLFAFPVLYSTAQPKVTVQVYPGTELLNVIHLLSDSAYFVPSTYRQAILRYFQPYKHHPAVIKARDLPFINCDFPLRLSWAFYHFPKARLHRLDTLMGYGKYFTTAQINDYFQACLSFYNDSKFWQFFKSYRKEYETWMASFERNLYNEGMLAALDSFYRFRPAKQVVFTLGAANCGSYALVDMQPINPVFRKKMVIMVAYGNIVGRKAANEKQPDFYAPVWSSQLIWHEMGHAYLSGLFERYAPAIDSLKYIYNRDTLVQKQAGTMGWSMYLNENITQAVTSYLRIAYGKNSQDGELKRITGDGFYRFVPALIEMLQQDYQFARYKSFTDFFPVLLQGLGNRHAP